MLLNYIVNDYSSTKIAASYPVAAYYLVFLSHLAKQMVE